MYSKFQAHQIQNFSMFVFFFLVVAASLGCSSQTEQTDTLSPPSEHQPPTTSPTNIPDQPAPPAPDELPSISPAPEGSLSSQGPWFVFSGPGSLWALNADGSGLTQIADEVVKWNRDWTSGVSPSGGHVAYISGQDDFYNLALNIYSFQSDESRLITPLVSPELEPDPDVTFERVEAIESIAYFDSLAWSPDGSQLAFIGALDGLSSDLYIYLLADGSIIRLTDGPSQAYQLSWSPDGKNILHYGVETFGTGAGYALTGTYAARADDSGIITLSGPFSGDEIVVGWLDARSAVVYSWSPSCEVHDLHSLNIETSAETMLFAGPFRDAVMEPASGSIIVLVSESSDFCAQDAGQGLHLIPRGGSPFHLLKDKPSGVLWSPDAGQFFARTEFGVVAVSTAGDWVPLETLTGKYPAANPLDKSLAWYGGDSGLWLSPFQVTPDGPQPQQVFDQRVLFASWDPSGQYLLFMGEDYVSVLHRPSMQIFTVAEGVGGRVGVWVNP